jgi:HEAT repeat protein
LQDKEAPLRDLAAKALYQIRTPEALQALEDFNAKPK